MYIVIVMLLLGAMLLAGCGPTATPAPVATSEQRLTAESTEVLNITVSIVPQKYFLERVGGEHVSVNVMVPHGASPATYEPKPEQLKALSQAKAYMRIHVPFEKAWMDRIAAANSEMMIVDTTQGIEPMPMGTHHHHGQEEKHRHGEKGEGLVSVPKNPDPHVWLSPSLVKIQVQTIYDALVQLDSEHKVVYQANLESFLGDIDALDAEIRKTLEGVKSRKFMVFHPAWGYFARDYGLELIPIEVGGQEPSAAELAALITEAKEEGIKVIFAQPEFSTRDAETIAKEIGGEVLLISPLMPDWLSNMRRIAETFAEVLGQ